MKYLSNAAYDNQKQSRKKFIARMPCKSTSKVACGPPIHAGPKPYGKL
jgi:hypothetical protein